MATNDNTNTTTPPITVLPPGSGNQIDRVREWEDRERTNTRSIMDRQTRKMGGE